MGQFPGRDLRVAGEQTHSPGDVGPSEQLQDHVPAGEITLPSARPGAAPTNHVHVVFRQELDPLRDEGGAKLAATDGSDDPVDRDGRPDQG